MDDRFQRRGPWIPWVIASVMFVLVALAGYSFGTHQEAAAAGAAPAEHQWHYYYPFSGIWMLFIFFWMFGGFRRMCWGGPYRPWHYRRYYGAPWRDERDDWEEWHRREHERMNVPRGSAPSSRSDPAQGPL